MISRTAWNASVVAIGLLCTAALPAIAVPISGTGSVVGFASIDGTNLTNNTRFDFIGSPTVLSTGTGDLSAFVSGASAALDVDPWTFTGSFVSQSPFLTLTNGADSVVFNLDGGVNIANRSGNDSTSSLTLFLLGHLVPSGPGFAGLDPEEASLSFAATASGTVGGFTISLAAPPAVPPPTSVPEPATVALVGLGLFACGAMGRRSRRRRGDLAGAVG